MIKQKTYLLLGSNLGNPVKQLQQARKYINNKVGTILRESSLYQTAAWGDENQPDFINQVIVVETKLSAQETMKSLLNIEKDMGRKRTVRNAARTIDIDILFFGKEVLLQKDLEIPHPRIQLRRFVLVPLNELSPMMKHPVNRQTIHRLLAECPDTLDVKKI